MLGSDVLYSVWFCLVSVVAIRPGTAKRSDVEMDSFVALQVFGIMERSVTALELADILLWSTSSI